MGSIDKAILVTGASGLLGSNLALHAIDIGRQVICVYHNSKIDGPLLNCVQIDLTNQVQVNSMFEKFSPEWVVHCAAATDVDWCENNPTLAQSINSTSSKFVAMAARKFGSRLIYISTDSVFSGDDSNYTEFDQPNPINIYSNTKLSGEKKVEEEIPDALIIRTNIYGWNPFPKLSLAEWVLKRLKSSMQVHGFEDVIFNPILVNDLSDIILDCINYKLNGLYHIVGSESCSKYEFAKQVARLFGLNENKVVPVPIASKKLKAMRPINTSLDTRKIQSALGKNIPGVIQGLERMLYLRNSGFQARLSAIRGG